MLVRLRRPKGKASPEGSSQGAQRRKKREGGAKIRANQRRNAPRGRTRCRSSKKKHLEKRGGIERSLPDDEKAVQAGYGYPAQAVVGRKGGMSGVMDLFWSRGDAKK